MRFVFKSLVLATFVVGTALTVGCDSATTDTPAATSDSSTSSGSSTLAGNVSQVKFDVTGMS